jgi:outer membrane protein assembly factor BamB
MNPIFAVRPALLFVCLGLGLIPATPGESAPGSLLGTWSGEVHHGSDSKVMALRFEVDEKKNAIVAFFDLPDLKFHNLGPIPVQQQGEEYKADDIAFRFAPDEQKLTGLWSFDGHKLPFELKPSAPLPAPGRRRTTELVAKPVWTFKTGGAIWSSPSSTGDTVYFGSDDGIIYALGADSGKPLWQFKTSGRVKGRPTLDGSYLYALSDDGQLYKLERHSGKCVWQFDTHGGSVPRDPSGSGTAAYDDFTSAASISDGTVYIGSADKKLYAVDAKAGQEIWHFDTQGIVRSTPTVAGRRVFFGSRDHNIYAVDARTGVLQWKYDTLREVVSSPLVVRGNVYIGSRSSDLLALDANTGKVKWKYFYWSSWVESSARTRGGILYVGSSDAQQLFALNADTGERVWNFDTDGSAWSTPAVTEKRVFIGVVGVLNYIVDHHGGFFAIDRSTGSAVWSYPMGVIAGSVSYGVASSPTVSHGLVFFGGIDGVFYAFRADQ